MAAKKQHNSGYFAKPRNRAAITPAPRARSLILLRCRCSTRTAGNFPARRLNLFGPDGALRRINARFTMRLTGNLYDHDATRGLAVDRARRYVGRHHRFLGRLLLREMGEVKPNLLSGCYVYHFRVGS